MTVIETGKSKTKLFVKKRSKYDETIFSQVHTFAVYLYAVRIRLDGQLEEVLMDKITSRIEKLCDGLNMDFIDPVI